MRSDLSFTSQRAWLTIVIGLLALLVWRSSAGAAVIQEDFATDPRLRGWRGFGETNLHRWNPAQQHLEVVWDSSRSNSFFAWPLGTVLGNSDAFSFSFDVRLADIRVGTTPNKPDGFQIAIGLLNSTNLTSTNYYVGTGLNPRYGIRSVVDFNYFPAVEYSNTFASVVAPTNNSIKVSHNFPLEMTIGDTFRITLAVSNRVLRTTALRNGIPYGGTFPTIALAAADDFRVDTFAIVNYSDAVQAGPPGSVLAHGVVDNVSVVLPPTPVRNLVLQNLAEVAEARFNSSTNWRYRLDRSGDLKSWSPVSAPTMGNGAVLTLRDNSSLGPAAFYRVEATRP